MSYISNPLYGSGGGGTLYPTLENTATGLLNDGSFENTLDVIVDGIVTASNIYPQDPNTTYLNCSITTDELGYIQTIEDGNVGEFFTSGIYPISNFLPNETPLSCSNNLELDEGFYGITQEIDYITNPDGTTSPLKVEATLGVYFGVTFIQSNSNTLILNGNDAGAYANLGTTAYSVSTFLNVPTGDTYTLNTEMTFTGSGSNPRGAVVIKAYRLR